MHIETYVMRQTVGEVLPQRLSMQVFSMRVDVVVSDLVQAVRSGASESHAWFGGGNRGFLRAEDNVVDFALPGSEFAADRNGARDIAGIVVAFGGDIHHRDFASIHAARIARIVKRG